MSINALTNKYTAVVNCIKTPAKIENPITHQVIETFGIWDTGATNSCITSELAQALNLPIMQKTIVNGVHGQKEVNVYLVKITLNNENIFVRSLVTEASELSDDHQTGLLIGMNIISQGDLCITNFDKKTTLTFRVPSLECIDYVAEINNHIRIVKIFKAQEKHGIKKCPCNSGKSFENCCQKNKYNQ